MPTKNKIASSASAEDLAKLLNQYFYSSTYTIENNAVFRKGVPYPEIKIESKKGRLIAYTEK